eukprot:CAMPEP_0198146460 /NCGR_PEP_ID=MMETSP1443-20131203/29590_1 /TAXON_ID=186043 /ORGANISM="Entomoneis sp., Strain CCMP2396" /LENGTH=485 /DNA_ID=CAMNT_0043810443 /DNA_START=9 /DNA_END=1466 /DNA_ORIENTATION=+
MKIPKIFVACTILLGTCQAFQNALPLQHGRVGFFGPANLDTSFVKNRRQKEDKYITPLFIRASSDSEDGDVYTIQILMSDTGGGHRASANALRDAFDVLYPGKIQCDIVDIFTDYAPIWPLNDVVALYKIMAKYPITWAMLYYSGANPFGLWMGKTILELTCFDAFKKCLNRPSGNTGKRADMVVSVHPLCQDVPLMALADLDTNGATRDVSARKTAFCTVVTDLGGAHPTWFNPGVSKCFVPSDVLRQAAKDRMLQDSQLIQHGLPIRRGFWSSNASGQPKSREILRQELGIDPSLPTALVVGGGDGMGGLVSIAEALGEKLESDQKKSSQLVVVCGNNQQAKQALEGKSWGSGVSVHVKGFVENMDEWMRASDVLVTKAGPGTIAEASICGLPCLMFSYLPGQEAGNIPYVEEAGFGKYSGQPDNIASTVSGWLKSPEMLKNMQQSALDAARPEATLDIARDLAAIVFATESKKREKVAVLRR